MDTNSLEFSYWAGFIAADGNLSENGNISIHLSDIDIGHLVRYKEFLGEVSKAKVRSGRNGDCYFSIMDAVKTGQLYGFGAGSSLTFNTNNADATIGALSGYTTAYRSSGVASFSDEDRKKAVEK